MATKKTTAKTTSARKTTKKKSAKPAQAKKPRAKAAGAKESAKAKKLSAIDAAAKVLGEATAPMGTREMIEAMAAKGYWRSPGGATPSATLYSAILREIGAKKKDARFRKVARGKFTLRS